MNEEEISISFDHYLLFTKDLEKTVDWYSKVLDIKPGPTPDFDVPVHWLYLGDHPIIHAAERSPDNEIESYIGKVDYQQETGSGLIDHIAFNSTGLTKMLAKLDSLGVDYTERRVDTNSRYQIFFFDPNGVKIELDFQASEAGNRLAPS
jgi:catechol 2,3-dioxygenase-like lactoylglutathione lyase family enzyme|tara:strand:- start:122 stop:568 length:447 start_codon:yes stop_codon:yes gene_type:complete